MHLNLGSILQASAQARPDHVAIKLGEQSLAYRELDRAARGVAAGLRARGLAAGDRVGLLVPNVPDFTIAYYGILYAGCTVVPVNVLCTAPEVTYFLQDSEARLLIAHPLFEAAARAGAEAAGVPVVWAGKTGSESLAELAAAPPVAALHPTLADRHRGDPLHLGHHGQAQGRRAHALEPADQLRRRRAEAGADSAATTSRSRRSRSSTPSGRPASRTPRSRSAPPSRCCRASAPTRRSRSWSAIA